CPRCNSTRGNADAISFYNGIYQTRAYVQRLGEHPIKGNGTQRRAETRKRKAKNKELRKLREEADKLAALEDGSKDNLLRTFREMGWKL
ncbi:hypothetical protein CL634_08330, partial [bacterium]|nr:hypothetical protein [bacterium]